MEIEKECFEDTVVTVDTTVAHLVRSALQIPGLRRASPGLDRQAGSIIENQEPGTRS